MAQKVALVLTPGFADWEYAFIAGVGGPFYGLDVAFFAPEAGTLRSQGGLTVEVERSVAELADWAPAAIVVVGGTVWESEQAPDIGALLNPPLEGFARRELVAECVLRSGRFGCGIFRKKGGRDGDSQRKSCHKPKEIAGHVRFLSSSRRSIVQRLPNCSRPPQPSFSRNVR